MSKELYPTEFDKMTVIIESKGMKITHEFPVIRNLEIEIHESEPELSLTGDYIHVLPIVESIDIAFKPLQNRDGVMILTKKEVINE